MTYGAAALLTLLRLAGVPSQLTRPRRVIGGSARGQDAGGGEGGPGRLRSEAAAARVPDGGSALIV